MCRAVSLCRLCVAVFLFFFRHIKLEFHGLLAMKRTCNFMGMRCARRKRKTPTRYCCTLLNGSSKESLM